jgi:CspA family cold shock protein
MATGTVKFFNHSRGFGFIEPEDGGKDVFVHVTAVEQAGISSLEEGDKVEYEVKPDERSGKSSAGDLKKV